MRRSIAILALLAFAAGPALVLLFPRGAEAVPAFARKYGKNCSTCHTAWPLLNKAGRMFKENGYRFPTDEKHAQKISDFLYWGKTFPVTAILVARPYDKKKSGDEKLRALHEVELMAAGVLYKNVSGFLELEAEDETGFEPEIPYAALGYHPLKALNVHMAWGPLLAADPYDTYTSRRRLTRGHYAVVDQAFGGADNGGKLRNPRQVISLYGRPIKQLFYTVGVSGVAEDAEGENPRNLHGRLAVDVIPEATVGLFGLSGGWESAGTTRDFSRVGVDVQAEFSGVRLMGAYLQAKDDRATTGTSKNNAWYAQALYVVKQQYRPLVVPLVRYDSYEKNDGKDTYNELTLNVGYYFTQNIKGIVEYWTQTKVPDGQSKDNRFTVQLYAAF